jgi:hypothetical protein
MKQLFIFATIVLLCAVASCRAQHELSHNEESISAWVEYSYWSVPVPGSPELEERGIDLIITTNAWKEEYEPLYVIFDQRKSFLPEVEEVNKPTAVLRARVVLDSQLLDVVSEKSDLSDRLVYRRSDGTEGYIEIGKREETRTE